MADEIKIDLKVQVEKGNFKDTFNPSRFLIDQDTQGKGGQVYTIGTSEEAISFTDISTEGWLVMQNLDTSNYVDWGPEDSSAMIEMGRMEAGEPAILRMFPTAVLRLKANTAACKVMITLYED